MIRVLVVDDSPVARGLLTEILNSEPDIEVVGEATNGVQAVALVTELQPDLVTMDVQMPGMNGYDATREIMVTQPTPIVVVSGSMGATDIEKSMQSLDAGALTVIGKPASPTAPGFEEDCRTLHETVRTMAAVTVIRRHRTRNRDTPRPDSQPSAEPVPQHRSPIKLITMAASTGGPQTIREILGSIPKDFPVPIVLVQHISVGFSTGLIDWLNNMVDVQVAAAGAGDMPLPGHVYIAPEDNHCAIGMDGRLQLLDSAPRGGFRPSATVLFESASRCHGSAQCAVILTGMGRDGVDGLKSVRQTGGFVIAQDEESCVVFGMPKAAIDAGVVDAVLPPDDITAQLNRLALSTHV